MVDYNDLISIIKQAANESVNAAVPVAVVFGTVTAVSPLSVKVDAKLQLGERQLVLTRNVTDFENDQTAHDHQTENRGGGGGYAAYESHNHVYTGRKHWTVHHKLLVGDKVLMLREQGGQRYVIIDRVVMA